MRIVLTNAGQQEINNDIYHTLENTSRKYKSVDKNNARIFFHRINNSHIKKNQRIKSINHNISHVLTEQNYLNEIINNKNSLKKEKSLINNDNIKVNNYKFISVLNKNSVPKEIQELYIKEDKKNSENKNINDINAKKPKQEISLGLINDSLQLKDILQNKNIINANKNILYKKINKNEKNLINYLKSNRTIKPSFMEKIGKASDNKLVKLDKICQIYFNNEKKNEFLKQNIRDKIKVEYSNDSKFCKENLLNMGKNIQNCRNIHKFLDNQKEYYLDKRNRALFNFKNNY